MTDRVHQVLLLVTWLVVCWLLMQAVHESGHVIGAVLTGGQVQRVVLHPLAISRTDVSPNPQAGVVVWLGPLLGCLLPLAVALMVPSRFRTGHTLLHFFAGFCLIANGAYIGIGSFHQIGDSGEMLRTGTPQWAMLLFSTVTILAGLALWHRLGSFQSFLATPELVSRPLAYAMAGLLFAIMTIEAIFSSR